jgi:hypothetical protein
MTPLKYLDTITGRNYPLLYAKIFYDLIHSLISDSPESGSEFSNTGQMHYFLKKYTNEVYQNIPTVKQ